MLRGHGVAANDEAVYIEGPAADDVSAADDVPAVDDAPPEPVQCRSGSNKAALLEIRKLNKIAGEV